MADDEAAANEKARRGVQAIFDRYHKLAKDRQSDLYDYECMSTVELLTAQRYPKPVITYRFKVPQSMQNLNNVLHGGGYGVLFDMFTMSALGTVARPGYWEFMGGVTRQITINYLRAVPVGTTVLFRSEVIQHGRTLALIRGEMLSEDGATVLATAEHQKVNTPMLKEHREKGRVQWDEDMEREEEEEKKKKASKL